MSAGEARRNVGIDVLRAVAILSVVAHHWVNSGLASPERSAVGRVSVQMAGHGYYGVTLFFTLSGFLITRMIMMREPDLFRLSLRDFYIRRIARVQPLFLGVVAFGGLMLIAGDTSLPMFGQTYRETQGCFAGDFWISLFTFTFNWDRIARGTFCGQHWDIMWSLAVEEQFYLAFPLVLLWARNKKRLLRILLTVVIVGIAVRIASDVLRLSLFGKVENSFVCFDTMALGVLMAVFGEHLPRGRTVSAVAVGLGAVALAVAFYRSGVVFLIVGGCLFLHGARYGELFRHWAWTLVARFGQLSYGIYLLHPTAIYLASSVVQGRGVLTGFAVVTAIVLCLAEVTYRLYEAPGNAWIRSMFIRPARALPVQV